MLRETEISPSSGDASSATAMDVDVDQVNSSFSKHLRARRSS
jgi:hypothetical protein